MIEFSKLKKIFTKVRVIILILFLLASAVVINPSFREDGVAIRSVDINSSAALAGIEAPTSNVLPRQREVIETINNQPISTISDYYDYVEGLPPNVTVLLDTDSGNYRLVTQPLINKTVIDYEEVVVQKVNETLDPETNETINKTYNVTERRPIYNGSIIGTEDLGLTVYDAPTSNIKLGLDFVGGTRVLLEPEKELNEKDMDILIQNLKERLNVFGLSDLIVKSAEDMSGQQYILVEIPGANKEEVKDLLSRQGKFEAKIGNNTVFLGGDDIKHVCRTADCSGIDPQQPCGRLSDGETWSCRFRFAITLSNEAAERQANITEQLEVIADPESGQEYLSEDLDLYLDNSLVDSLKISSQLKGEASTDISISGSGVGMRREEAMNDALENMKRLQTILITGSLPVKLEVVKTDNISPVLGREFIQNAMMIGVFALIAVAFVIFIKYRTLKIVIPMIITMFSELLLLLGFGALAGWNIDLSAIAGIIIAIGTGLDHQIVITDEILKGEKLSGNFSWAQKLKRAFSIIMVAYFTTMAAMFFLLTAGAGLLKGFALTTMMGVTLGVLITRPAFASVMEILLKE